MRIALVLGAATVLLTACGKSESTTTVVRTTTAETTTTLEVTTTVEAPTTETAPDELAALDPDDVDSQLDVRDLTSERDGDLLTTRITMYEPWESTVLGGASVVEPGTERMTILYDVDLDGRADYRGAVIFGEDGLGVFVSGSGQAFEPLRATRVDPATVSVTHPVDVFFVVTGEGEIDSERDIQVAVTTSFEGVRDRAPDAAQWVSVPFRP